MNDFLRRMGQKGYGVFCRLRNGTIALIFSVAAVAAEPVTVVALGDSLTAGYGLAPEEGLVPQLESWLKGQGADVVVQNAGVSGDTTAGGLSRLAWALGPEVDALIVTLGGNDMMRGISPAEVRSNLDAILTEAGAKGLPVLLVGMTAPSNFGADYKTDFDGIYPDLAAKHSVALMPDFFDGFRAAGADMADPASYAGWMQSDGIHPNAEGVVLIVQSLGPHVLDLVEGLPGQ